MKTDALHRRAERRLRRAWRRLRDSRARHVLAGHGTLGTCSICERRTLFLEYDSWLRDHWRCVRCRSIPRQRALFHVLNDMFPGWRDMRLHESSPGGASSKKLARECRDYVGSHFYPDVPLGASRDGLRCENLEKLSFPDASFDLCVTQDVMEHVLDPAAAFAEIARILRPGGAHVFTVPIYPRPETTVRARPGASGIEYLAPKEFHGNPISAEGSLVVREWGRDLPDFIRDASGLATSMILTRDRRLGLDGEFLEVCVTRKPAD